MHQAITQSLVGRTALLELLPLSLYELDNAQKTLTNDEYLFYGGFPRIYNDQLNPTEAFRNYLHTYIERDIRQLMNVKDLDLFQRFIKLCAGRVGQVVNLHGLRSDIGVSHHALRNWLSLLQATFLIYLLSPYYENFGKRIIKSPKLYFTDVGLVTYLLDINSIKQLDRGPLRGALVENMVLLELIKY